MFASISLIFSFIPQATGKRFARGDGDFENEKVTLSENIYMTSSCKRTKPQIMSSTNRFSVSLLKAPLPRRSYSSLLAKVMPKDNNTRDFSYLSCQDA
jgi:hypothetical protein